MVFAGDYDVVHYKKNFQLNADQKYVIKVNIDVGRVWFTKSETANEILIVVRYIDRAYRVDVDYNESRHKIAIDVEKREWFNKNSNETAEVRVEFPSAIEFELYSKIKAGEVDLELGGLSLVELTLTTWAGEVVLDFAEPNHKSLQHLEINTKIGETSIKKLGNARFVYAEINGGIGEMHVDFGGDYLSNATALIDLDIGETKVFLPETIGVKTRISKLNLSSIDVGTNFKKSGKYYYSQNYDEAEVALDLDISPGLGELKIH